LLRLEPVEVPKLNGAFAAPVGQVGNATVVAVRVVDVEREDGTLAQIAGEFDLKIVEKGGEEIVFKHPVSAEREGDDLVIRGGNRAATRIALSDIVRAEVSEYSSGKTITATAVAVPLGMAAFVGIGLAVASAARK
jgi:hypothetical protein